jgi:hypothetical protein
MAVRAMATKAMVMGMATAIRAVIVLEIGQQHRRPVTRFACVIDKAYV